MTKKPAGIPLEALLTSPGFERNAVLLLDSKKTFNPTASPELAMAIASLAVSEAVKRAESKQQQSARNSDIAKAKRKEVTREDLARVREEYMYKMQTERDWPEGRDHGWKEYALGEDRLPVRITRKTLDARWKGK